MKLILRDPERVVIEAWEEAFEGAPDVLIEQQPILSGLPVEALISPICSQGFMDHGLSLLYSMHFGWSLQTRLKGAILERFQDGKLPVGQAELIRTLDSTIPYCVSTAVVETPQGSTRGTENVYRAFKAALNACYLHNNFTSDGLVIQSVLSSCLEVGIQDHQESSDQMRRAWDEVRDLWRP